MHAPASSIKEPPNLTLAAPQPSHLITLPDVAPIRPIFRDALPPEMDHLMSSPSPLFPDNAVFLGGDDDAAMSDPLESPPDHLPFYYQGWEVASPEYTLKWLAGDPNCPMDGPGREPVTLGTREPSPSSGTSLAKRRCLEDRQYSPQEPGTVAEPYGSVAMSPRGSNSRSPPSGFASPEDLTGSSRGDAASLPSTGGGDWPMGPDHHA